MKAQRETKKSLIPQKILYIILLTIFSASSVGLVADLDSLYWVEVTTLLLILLGGYRLISLSFQRRDRRDRE